MQTNILFTGDIIYCLNAQFDSDAACLSSTLCESEAISQSLRAISAHRSSDM